MAALKTKTDNLATARDAHLMSRAYNHKFRQQVIALLQRDGETCVTDIYTHRDFKDEVTGRYLDQSQVSQHLAILRNANLLECRRQGKFIYYKVNEEVLAAVKAHIDGLAALFSDN